MSARGLLGTIRRPWTPGALGADNVLQLSARDAGTLYSDTAGTTLASNGDHVAYWRDRSQYNYSPTEAVSSFRPTRDDTGYNGKRGLYFDGGDALITPTMSALSGATAWELWVSVMLEVTGSSKVIIELSANAAGTPGAFLLYTPSSAFSQLSDGNVGFTQVSKTSSLNTSAHVIRCTGDYGLSTNEVNIYIDGVAGTSRPLNSNNTGSLGSFKLYLMARNESSNFAQGWLRDVVVFRRGLTATEVGLMETWMAI